MPRTGVETAIPREVSKLKTRAAEAIAAAGRFIQLVDFLEGGALYLLKHQLADLVASVDLEGVLTVEVHQDDLYFTAVVRVDEARGVNDTYAVSCRKPTARLNETGMPLWYRHGDPGRHQCPLPRLKDHVGNTRKVTARIALVRVSRQLCLGVDSLELYRKSQLSSSPLKPRS